MDTLKAIKRLAHERDNLAKLLDCWEAREVQWRKLRELVKEWGAPHSGFTSYCWCQMRIGNPMVRTHSELCRQLFKAIFGGEREKDASGEG
jgi:hypothetical protein